jgi:hypothetical protein
MSKDKTIEDVQKLWDSYPLGSGFIDHPLGSREWILEFDRIKNNFDVVNVLDERPPSDVRGKRALSVGCGPGFWSRLFVP